MAEKIIIDGETFHLEIDGSNKITYQERPYKGAAISSELIVEGDRIRFNPLDQYDSREPLDFVSKQSAQLVFNKLTELARDPDGRKPYILYNELQNARKNEISEKIRQIHASGSGAELFNNLGGKDNSATLGNASIYNVITSEGETYSVGQSNENRVNNDTLTIKSDGKASIKHRDKNENPIGTDFESKEVFEAVKNAYTKARADGIFTSEEAAAFKEAQVVFSSAAKDNEISATDALKIAKAYNDIAAEHTKAR